MTLSYRRLLVAAIMAVICLLSLQADAVSVAAIPSDFVRLLEQPWLEHTPLILAFKEQCPPLPAKNETAAAAADTVGASTTKSEAKIKQVVVKALLEYLRSTAAAAAAATTVAAADNHDNLDAWYDYMDTLAAAFLTVFLVIYAVLTAKQAYALAHYCRDLEQSMAMMPQQQHDYDYSISQFTSIRDPSPCQPTSAEHDVQKCHELQLLRLEQQLRHEVNQVEGRKIAEANEANAEEEEEEEEEEENELAAALLSTFEPTTTTTIKEVWAPHASVEPSPASVVVSATMLPPLEEPKRALRNKPTCMSSLQWGVNQTVLETIDNSNSVVNKHAEPVPDSMEEPLESIFVTPSSLPILKEAPLSLRNDNDEIAIIEVPILAAKKRNRRPRARKHLAASTSNDSSYQAEQSNVEKPFPAASCDVEPILLIDEACAPHVRVEPSPSVAVEPSMVPNRLVNLEPVFLTRIQGAVHQSDLETIAEVTEPAPLLSDELIVPNIVTLSSSTVNADVPLSLKAEPTLKKRRRRRRIRKRSSNKLNESLTILQDQSDADSSPLLAPIDELVVDESRDDILTTTECETTLETASLLESDSAFSDASPPLPLTILMEPPKGVYDAQPKGMSSLQWASQKAALDSIFKEQCTKSDKQELPNKSEANSSLAYHEIVKNTASSNVEILSQPEEADALEDESNAGKKKRRRRHRKRGGASGAAIDAVSVFKQNAMNAELLRVSALEEPSNTVGVPAQGEFATAPASKATNVVNAVTSSSSKMIKQDIARKSSLQQEDKILMTSTNKTTALTEPIAQQACDGPTFTKSFDEAETTNEDQRYFAVISDGRVPDSFCDYFASAVYAKTTNGYIPASFWDYFEELAALKPQKLAAAEEEEDSYEIPLWAHDHTPLEEAFVYTLEHWTKSLPN